MYSFDMFLGELGIRGLSETGGTFEMDEIPIPRTHGYTVSLTHSNIEGNIYTYFQTNIPGEIWENEEFEDLRKEVRQFINPSKKELGTVLMGEHDHIAFKIHEPQTHHNITIRK